MNADNCEGLESVVDENGKRKAHPVKLTAGNWIALAGLTFVVLAGGTKWLDRYQTKMDAKIAVLEQKLIDQDQQGEIDTNTATDTATQKKLKAVVAVTVTAREDIKRVLTSLRTGEDRYPSELPTGVAVDLEELLADRPAEP